jgi:hypothetical protein
VIMQPNQITIAEIRNHHNAEIRRVMLDRFGEDRFIQESGMAWIDRHPVFGDLYVDRSSVWGRPIARLKVTNRTAEPDGTFKIYWLPINPDLYDGDAGRFAQAAAASMWRTTPGGPKLFFERWEDYQPLVET